jgi:hypothetical protein
MRRLTIMACALLALPGCTHDAAPRTAPTTPAAPSGPATPAERETKRLPATLDAAPPGVRVTAAGPTCVLVERTGGTYGRPRYHVEVALRGLTVPSGTPQVYYDVTLDAGGRSYTGYLPVTRPHPRTGGGLWVLDPAPASTATLPVAPERNIGIQEIPATLTTCHLSLNRQLEQEILSGGRILGDATGSPVAVDPDGVPRPYSQR